MPNNLLDDKQIARLYELKALELTDKIIATRLGVSERTIRVYTRAKRTGLKPYEKPEDNVSS